MVLQAAIRAGDADPGFVVPDGAVEKVQTDAVGPVAAALLGLEVIEGAPIVLVDVFVLD